MDFHALPRRDLQTLCKLNKIPANMTNVAMADALQALPTVEGLDAIVQEAQQYLSPKKAAGMPEAPSRSCRRTSTRKQPNPPGSSVARTRRAAAFKNEAAPEKEDGGEDDAVVHGVGIPNSPTTLNSRGRRTRTLLTAGPLETGDEEVEAVKKVEPLPLEIPKTPAARATRGWRAKQGAEEVAEKQEEDGAPTVPQTPGATTARRASTRRGGARAAPALPLEIPKTPATRGRRAKQGAEEVSEKQEEDGAPAVVQTPGATTARRASTRRGGARAAPAPEEASGTRSTRYRTRRAVVEEPAVEMETAARTRITSASRKNSKKAADDGVLPGEDGAEGEAPADEGVGEALIPVAAASGGAAETEHPTFSLSAELTAEISQPISEMDGSDGLWADQTVEKDTNDIVVVEAAGSEGVDETAAEETISDDPTVVDEEVPMADSIDQTMDKAEQPADQTVGDALDDDQGVVVEGTDGSFDGHVDQTAVEELIQNITEISLHPTVDEEEISIAADQTADDGRDLVELLEVEMHPNEADGPVDLTVQEIQLSIGDHDDETIDPTVEDGDEKISACEETEAAFPEETPMVVAEESIVPTADDGDEFQLSTVDPHAETIDPTVVNGDEISSACEEAEEAAAFPEETPMVGGPEASGVPVCLVADVVAGGGIQLLPQEAKEEEAEKEEESTAAPGLVSSDGPLAETGKAEDLVQASMGGDGACFLVGAQDKENAAVKACLMGPAPKQYQQMAVENYDTTTSLRKLKAAYKEVLEEKKEKKRAALAALDDNCCITNGS